MAFLRREQAPPVLRGWARTRDEPVDVLFALLAGDILPPTVFNLGGATGWAPTVQLTALLRAHPAPGWLRVASRADVVAGPWFDEDVTVVDAAGRVVCQARQLALAPLPGAGVRHPRPRSRRPRGETGCARGLASRHGRCRGAGGGQDR